METVNAVKLDARDLEHPKPLELSIKALQELDTESYFYMIHRKNPIPLLELASEQGFQVLSREDAQGDWHVFISKNDAHNLDTFAQEVA